MVIEIRKFVGWFKIGFYVKDVEFFISWSFVHGCVKEDGFCMADFIREFYAAAEVV